MATELFLHKLAACCDLLISHFGIEDYWHLTIQRCIQSKGTRLIFFLHFITDQQCMVRTKDKEYSSNYPIPIRQHACFKKISRRGIRVLINDQEDFMQAYIASILIHISTV